MKRLANGKKVASKRREVDGQLRFSFYTEGHDPKATVPHQIKLASAMGGCETHNVKKTYEF